MCGIVGVAGTMFGKVVSCFEDMLQFDVVRGPHSTGVGFITKGKGANTVVKEVGVPQFLMSSKEYDTAISKKKNIALIGHNRAATRGKITDENAHPFQHDHIVGVHNGTLTSQFGLPDSTKFDVDSDNIMYALSKQTVEETYKQLRGAWSLCWWDQYRKRLCFVRNSLRPMTYVLSEDHKTLFWSSEKGILFSALSRNGLKWDEESFTILEPDTLYEFKIPKNNKVIQPPLETKLQPYVAPPSHHYNYHPPAHTATQSNLNKNKQRYKEGERISFWVTKRISYTKFNTHFEGLDEHGTGIRVYFQADEADKVGFDTAAIYRGTVNYIGENIIISPKSLVKLDKVEDDESDKEKKEEASSGFVDHNGVVLNKEAFDLRYGVCSWCNSEVEFEKQGNTSLAITEILCPACSENPLVLRAIRPLIVSPY